MSWAAKVRRRRPGIYLARTRKHTNPRRRENGYIGLSNNLALRHAQHMGRGGYGAPAKPWSDLDPAWHCLRLPWWLGWRWVLAPLEFLAIRLLLPRYNVTHNLGNPRRVSPYRQRAQRAQRDGIAHGDRVAGIWMKTERQAAWVYRIAAGLLLLTAGSMIASALWR